jgi:glycogen operon protein
MLSTLFVTHGTIMLTAGDEGGRSQQGNNNAYAQDNELTWFDWRVLNSDLVAHTAFLSSLRKRFAVFSSTEFFTGRDQDVEWLNPEGVTMSVADWERADGTPFSMLLKTKDLKTGKSTRLAVLFNRRYEPQNFILPRSGWKSVGGDAEEETATVPARSVGFYHQP